MDNWLILQNFYNGLTQSSRDHVDAAAGGAFFSLTIERATTLIEKMVSNQGWSDDRLQLRQRGMHSVKEADMLAIEIDLLLKKFEDYSLLTLLSAPDLYTASARFRVVFPLEYSSKVYQSTEPKRQETIY